MEYFKNIVDDSPQDKREHQSHLSDLFPKEDEPVKYVDTNFESLVYKDEDFHSLDCVAKDEDDGKVVIEDLQYDPNFHPNPKVRNPNEYNYDKWNTGYSNYGYGYNGNYSGYPNYGYGNLYMRANMDIFKEGYHNMSNFRNTMVDFSNPDSVAQSQSPFGYGGNNKNPNISYYDPYEYNPKASYSSWYNPSYQQQGWYGGNNWYYNRGRRNYSPPSDFDVANGFGIRIRIVSEEERSKNANKQKEKQSDIKISPKIVLVPDKVEEPKKEEVNDRPTNQEIIIPKENELNWSGKDEEEINELANKIAVYNEAIAYVLYNIPCMYGISREQYLFLKEAAIDRLNEYVKDEKEHPNLDYRVPYRYRELPSVMKNSQGRYVHNLIKVEFIPEKKYDSSGNRVYDYDRGRELTDKEWKLFCSRALLELQLEANKKRVKWIEDYNKSGGNNYEKYKNTIVINENYRYNDPIAIRCNEMKKKESKVNDLRWVYRKAIGQGMSDTQFDKWWDGGDLQRNTQESIFNNNLYQRRCQIYNEMMATNYVIANPEIEHREFLARQAGAIADLTDGCFDNAKTFNDVMEGFNYMHNKYIQIEADRQRKEMTDGAFNRYSYKKSLIRFGNETNPGFSNNFRPGSVFGQANPQYGFPSNYVDITNTDGYNERKAMFNNYCKNSYGSTVPMRPIYR